MLDWLDQTLLPGDCLFDVGANVGVYSLYAALRQPAASIMAFEPEFSNLALLRDNIQANALADRVVPYGIALGKETKLSMLHLQDLTPGAALHTESSEVIPLTQAGKPVIYREGISVYTLDEFCRQTGKIPTCLKIDVDGNEEAVLEGASTTLKSSSLRSIIMELSHDNGTDERCLQQLSTAGFKRSFEKEIAGCTIGIWNRSPQSVSVLASKGK
jgi:FkbM family methyltransferase